MTFWKPGTIAPGSDIEVTQLDRESEKEANIIVYNKNEHLSINVQRARLPISQNRMHQIYVYICKDRILITITNVLTLTLTLESRCRNPNFVFG
jgi:hypothetical protein